jgi:hypothetical protein
MEPMTGPLSRIIRAKEHLDALQRKATAFTASNPYRADIYDNLETGDYICYPYLTKPFTSNWGLIVGEIFHHLKAALDNIAWQSAILKDNTIEFPIFSDNTSRFTTKLEKLREYVRPEIEAIQPYHRPDGEKHRHPLSVIRRINIVDKHRVIIPGISKLWVATNIPKKFITIDFAFTRLNKGDVVFTIPKSFCANKDFQPKIKVQILFDVSTGCGDDSNNVIRITGEDISTIYQYVREIVYPRFAKFLEPINGFE